jgi:hypothetical protein
MSVVKLTSDKLKRASRRDNMKKQKETISVDITMNHYGFYHSDWQLGNEHKPYRDWVVKKTGIKKWEDYHSGMWTTDMEMIDDWIEETNQPYETLFSEKDEGIYIVDKDWNYKQASEQKG